MMSSSSSNVDTSAAAVMFLEEYAESIWIPIEEIESATNNFADENLVKQTPSAKMYKGRLMQSSSGEFINIVVRIIMQDETVMNELIMLKDLRHKHIVPIFKMSATTDDDDGGVIINKQEANESLDKHLNSSTLSWMQRLHICVGIADALKYLHYDAGENHSVIHGNIKTSKILLDHHWEPKLHGFGFAVRAKRNQLYLTDKYKGSLQYMDPAYENTRGLTHKSDVFSFGVVLFEVLFGRDASSVLSTPENNDSLCFARLARVHYEEKTLDDMIDPDLREQMNLESLNIFCETAYHCLKEQQSQRPDMKKVLPRLERALELQRKYENPEHSAAGEGTSSNHLKKNRKDNLQISLEAIKLSTQNFSDCNCTGKGRFWRLYEGEISLENVNGRTPIVAKRFDSGSDEGNSQFMTELKVLFERKHKNIVGLVGYCNEMGETIIVYEHASNGTLDKHLGNANLTWMERLKIGLDVARGLEYLHTGGITIDTSMIHRDIKSNSILLDGDWRAKLSNLEESSNVLECKKIEHIDDDNAYGSLSYIDPEYKGRGYLTQGSDRYSLGVVLLEMLLGRLSWAEECEGHSESLVCLAKKWYKEDTLDERIFEGIKEQIGPRSLDAYSLITFECLDDYHYRRLRASMVVEQLTLALAYQEDYEIWEPKLPKDYEKLCEMSKTKFKFWDEPERIKSFYDLFCKGVLFQEGKAWFSLGSNGKRNVMISAKKFSYTNRWQRKWRSIPESRFHAATQMLDISNLKIQIKIKPQLLLPGENYGVHLVFKFRKPGKNLAKRMYVNLKYKRGSENLHAAFATWREDGWMMIELCQILNYEEDTEFEVLLESFSRSHCGRSVCIEGIEFRTIDNEYAQADGSKEIEKYQETPKYEEIKKLKEVQQSPVDSKEISKCPGNAEEGFLLKEVQNEKICFMPSEMEAPYESSIAKPFHLKYSAESSFQGEIELSKQQVFGIKGKIDSQMLSPDTDYMCYLVFKLSETCHGLHCPVKVRNVLQWKNKEIGLICFRPPSLWNSPDTNGAPKERDDGWMEVLVWKFNSNSELRNDHIPMNLKFITYEGTMSGLIVSGLEIRPM